MTTLVGIVIALLAGGQMPTDTPPIGENATAQAKVEEILTGLEKRSAGLEDITCKVIYVEEDRINLSNVEKRGWLKFLMTEPNPHWHVHFAKTIVDETTGPREWYLFDGRWLYEAKERTEQVIKREFVRPGEKVDFFDLETAPFPLPFGQKKEQILEHFDVTLRKPSKGDPPDTDHLVCIPKPGSRMEDKYDKLELFIQRDVNLPSRVVVTKNKGLEVVRANFPDLSPKSINSGVKKKDFAEPKAWKGYELIVELLD